MDRIHWQRLSEERLLDAKALLAAGRWAAAYYIAGYAVECGLKACLLRRLQHMPEDIFSDRDYSRKVFNHDVDTLVKIAGLKEHLGTERQNRQEFDLNFATVMSWKETSRYALTSESNARSLFEAITVEPDGVMLWIRQHW